MCTASAAPPARATTATRFRSAALRTALCCAASSACSTRKSPPKWNIHFTANAPFTPANPRQKTLAAVVVTVVEAVADATAAAAMAEEADARKAATAVEIATAIKAAEAAAGFSAKAWAQQ